MGAEPYSNTAVWDRCRAEVLARDAGRCQIGGSKCTGAATAVDHIVPWRAGGSWYDLANLRASCSWCNSARARRGFSTRRNPSREW